MIVGILVVAALVAIWILLEKVFERGFDELWDGVARLFTKKGAVSHDSKSSMVLRDESDEIG